MLEVRNLSSGYGAIRVLHDVSFVVPTGRGVALLGRNGAGKSTILKTIMGLLPTAAGEVDWAGNVLTGQTADAIAQFGLGYVPEDRRVFASLTVEENLIAAEKVGAHNHQAWTQDSVFDLFPEIARRKNAAAGTLSGGERQMLAIARALMGNPAMLLLDEPSEGLAPVVVKRLITVLSEVQQSGMTILIAEQNRDLVEALADTAVVLETGIVRYVGSLHDFFNNQADVDRYLGMPD